MLTTLTAAAPTMGPVYDKTRPETRQPWLDFRSGGITATEVRDWRNGSRRRDIVTAKVTGVFEDLSYLPAVNHGNLREPVIGEWAMREYGIIPTDAAFSHADNPRYIASPDGVTLDPFTETLVVGVPESALLEIKTSVKDLTPGPVDARQVLQHVTPGSAFDRSGYYAQMQWQMFVMNASTTLFVWEVHNGVIDPETGTYTPVGVPQAVWVPRDQAVIDTLVEMADEALATIDAARLTAAGDFLPEASALPSEHAALVSDYLAALDAEKVAAAQKVAAFKALQGHYLGKADVKIDGGFASLSTSTTIKTKRSFDEDAARAAHPDVFEARDAAIAAYDAIVAEFTTSVDEETQTLTVRRKK